MQSKKIQQLKKKLNYRQRQVEAYYDHLRGKDIPEYQTQAVTVKLLPNKTMFNYMYNVAYWRNYWWNEGLDELKALQLNYEITHMDMKNDSKVKDPQMAKMNKFPSEYAIRNELVHNKSNAEDQVSSRSLQLTIKDLFVAFSSYRKHPEQFHMPKFKDFNRIQPNFKSDRIRIKNNRLYLDKPHKTNLKYWSPIKIQGNRSDLALYDDKPVLVSFYLKNGQWMANIVFRVLKHSYKHLLTDIPKTTGVDLNVHEFVDDQHLEHHGFDPCPKNLDHYYERLSWTDHRIARRKHLNKQLNIKDSKRLAKLLRQRQLLYRQIKYIQTDLCQKYTKKLVDNFTDITIEDLNVQGMKVSHKCKNTQRAMFGIFRQILTYKANWYGVNLNFADQKFPSTQRCSTCGHIKTGDDRITLYGNQKHHTKHDQYICYNPKCRNYLKDQGRDQNAEVNLNQLNYLSLITQLTIFALTNQPSFCNNNYEVWLNNQ